MYNYIYELRNSHFNLNLQYRSFNIAVYDAGGPNVTGTINHFPVRHIRTHQIPDITTWIACRLCPQMYIMQFAMHNRNLNINISKTTCYSSIFIRLVY